MTERDAFGNPKPESGFSNAEEMAKLETEASPEQKQVEEIIQRLGALYRDAGKELAVPHDYNPAKRAAKRIWEKAVYPYKVSNFGEESRAHLTLDCDQGELEIQQLLGAANDTVLIRLLEDRSRPGREGWLASIYKLNLRTKQVRRNVIDMPRRPLSYDLDHRPTDHRSVPHGSAGIPSRVIRRESGQVVLDDLSGLLQEAGLSAPDAPNRASEDTLTDGEVRN